jgi:protease stability complex PrcB-like protein
MESQGEMVIARGSLNRSVGRLMVSMVYKRQENILKHTLLSLVIVLLITFSSCSVLSGARQASYPGKPVPITSLGPKRSGPRWSFANNSGLWDRLRVVIRDIGEWSDVWKRINSPDPTHGPYSPLPPLPEIDFSRDMLIVVALGARPTGSYGIIIDGAYEKDNRLEIVVRSVSPGKSCFVTQSYTQPVDIVRVARTERPVVFRETELVHECK